MRFVENRHCVVKSKSEGKRSNRRAGPAQSAMMKSDLRRLTVSGVTGRLPLWVMGGGSAQRTHASALPQ
jgi:hypothetical protein